MNSTLNRMLMLTVLGLCAMVFFISCKSSKPAGLDDGIEPALVDDLRLLSASSSTLTLAWTAVGDDGASGRAHHYELRFSLEAINSDNFTQSQIVPNVSDPGEAGDEETCIIGGLSASTSYYIGLAVHDEAGNRSEIAMLQAETPAADTELLVLDPLWSMGSNSDVLIGWVLQAGLNAQGEFCLLDALLEEITVLTIAGEYVATISRQGHGPGELWRPVGMTQFESGDYGVLQMLGGEVDELTSDGWPIVECSIDQDPLNPPPVYGLAGLWGENRLIAKGLEQTQLGSGVFQKSYFVRGYGQDCSLTADYWAQSIEVDANSPPIAEEDEYWKTCAIGIQPDGNLAISEQRNEYEISIRSENGEIALTLSKAYDSWSRDARATELASRRFDGEVVPVTISATEPDISDIVCRPDGEVWVQASRGRWEPPAGVFTVYDVFDASGSFDRQVKIACPGDAAYDRLLFVGDYVFHVTGYWAFGLGYDIDSDPMVTCYLLVQ